MVRSTGNLSSACNLVTELVRVRAIVMVRDS